jgi:hypothetical protein
MAADGSFVVAWDQRVEKEEPGNPYEIPIDVFFRRFNADGRPFGPEAVAIGGFDEQSRPKIAIQPDGSFIITCNDYNGEATFYDILARLFSRSGAPLGDEFQVNDSPYPEASQYGPSIAVARDGRFALAWTDRWGDYDRIPNPSTVPEPEYTSVVTRVYAADGTPLGPEHPVNVFVRGEQILGDIGALPTGGFLVLWTSWNGQDGDKSGIFGRVVGADGNPRGRELRVNINRTGDQYSPSPSLSIAPNGKGAVAWSSPDGDDLGVFSRLLGTPRQGS